MNEKQFDELLQSVRDMGRHMRGQAVAGVRVHDFPDPDVKAIRERTGLSQTRFAYLIGVKPKTLQNWEQHRVRPAGPARALLKIVELNPEALSALHG
ncbi:MULTISPECIES: helix-turn-helix domain-containing protein [Extensimonas]|uniref:Putative transcriptional regulator n=1 Tax=Extensimonas vulgaris TaxID=1031594 RepID=A0A369AMG6_9BURK|nr:MULTISPECIES: helix-turn-helix domain-containing protein [Extensimonas]MDF1482670.1 helix-turn-helix domain-containing protein [Extensimonas sp. H3M7-6]RCX10255.1 putative transcriptional regulator [Extensimonas vulgaris]TWI39832.1 putative transcriptional regulator [Extensimonas vulgaris]TXD17397.1 helix-turn-helix domain-containing protein [Extensimonas vulgaris]